MANNNYSVILQCPNCNHSIKIELTKVYEQPKTETKPTLQHPEDPISDNQKRAIYAISKKKNIPMPVYEKWNKLQASDWIEENGR
jgi:hypothetical protein